MNESYTHKPIQMLGADAIDVTGFGTSASPVTAVPAVTGVTFPVTAITCSNTVTLIRRSATGLCRSMDY